MSRTAKQWISITLIVLGAAFAVIAFMYLTKGVRDLPSFLPGKPKYIKHLEALEQKLPKDQQKFDLDRKLTKRGIAAGVVSLLCFVGAWYTSTLRKPPAVPAAPAAPSVE